MMSAYVLKHAFQLVGRNLKLEGQERQVIVA